MRHKYWSARVLTLLLLVAATASVQPARAQSNELQIIITQVDGSRFPLVTIYVSITGRDGKPAVGLTQGELIVTEDSKPVEVVEFKGSGGAPVNTLLILDRSGSMQGPKLAGAQQAAKTFVDLMRVQDQVGLLLFAGSTELAQPLTGDKAALQQKIAAIQLADDTALYDAALQGLELVKPVEGRKSALLLSDGMDNRDHWLARIGGYGSQHTLEDVVAQAGKSGVTLYTIGLGERTELNEGALRQLAEQTGGAYYYAPSAEELAALYRSLAQQFQTEYSLTYRSPRAAYDGTRRGIEVAVNASGGQTGSGGSTYIEQHLLQLRSMPLAGFVLSAILLVALAGPLVLRRRMFAPGAPPLLSPQPISSPPAPDRRAPPAATAPDHDCRYCGAPLRATAQFCTRCGRRQDGP